MKILKSKKCIIYFFVGCMKNLVFFENPLINSGTFVLIQFFQKLARLALGGGGILKRCKLDYALRLNVKKKTIKWHKIKFLLVG